MFYHDFDKLEREHYNKMLDEVRREHQIGRIFKKQDKVHTWFNAHLSHVGERLIQIGEHLQQHDAASKPLKITHPSA